MNCLQSHFSGNWLQILMFAILLLSALPALSQQSRTWEELWQEMQADADDEDDEEVQDEAYERLAQLARSPLDLNKATREDLEQLPFLSELQVMDLLEYLHRYGPMRSLGELKMIRSLDYWQQELLPFFVYVDDEADEPLPTSSRRRTYHPHAEVTFTGRVPFYERKGDVAGYLGYRYRHSLRAEYSEGERLKVGLIGSQDAGEPFFAGDNRWGYDNYSYYVQVDRLGIFDKAIVGKYRVSAGMGLVLGGSFRLGKLASLMSLGRQPTTLRPHSSRSQADYFRGAAATVRLLGNDRAGDAALRLTAFVSHRPIDATLADDGTAVTLVTSGYHRTVSEMARKDNTHLTAFGSRLAFTKGGWRVGLNAVHTHLDRRLQPSTTALFRQYYPAGTDFLNASLDYSYTRPRLTVSGETAVNRDGAVASVNSLGWQPSSNVSIMALWRHYSYRYTGLYSHSFGDNASAQNEQGFFLGTTWKPLRRLTLRTYADYAWFPWAKYLVSQPSQALDFILQAEYRTGKWQLLARGRTRFRERDNEDKTALTANNEYRLRLAATRDVSRVLSLRTQLDASRAFYLQASRGWMLSEHLTWQPRSWLLCATAGYFHTDDFASRIYLYERQMTYEYIMPSYFGHGFHLAALVRKGFGKHLRVTARLGFTRYSDRNTIGSGLQLIDGPQQTDLDLQLRWKL